jgi:NAD+ diphosphatase
MNKVGVFNVAVAVVIENDDKILITKRSPNRDHSPNEWEAGITGRVDQGETCEGAAYREVNEEVGLEIELISPFATFHFYRGKEKAEHLGVNFWARYKSGEVVLQQEEQVEYKWVSPQEALQYVTEPNVIKEVKKFIEFKKRYKYELSR